MKPRVVNTLKSLLSALLPFPHKRPLLIALDGRPCSGKTTLARELEKVLDAQVLYLDEFFIPPSQWPQNKTPRFPFFYFRYEEFVKGITLLAAGRPFSYFKYDPEIAGLSSELTVINPDKIILVEGVSTLNPELVDLYFKKIWIISDLKTEFDAIVEREGEKHIDLWKNYYLPSIDVYCSSKPWLRADILYAGRGADGASLL